MYGTRESTNIDLNLFWWSARDSIEWSLRRALQLGFIKTSGTPTPMAPTHTNQKIRQQWERDNIGGRIADEKLAVSRYHGHSLPLCTCNGDTWEKTSLQTSYGKYEVSAWVLASHTWTLGGDVNGFLRRSLCDCRLLRMLTKVSGIIKVYEFIQETNLSSDIYEARPESHHLKQYLDHLLIKIMSELPLHLQYFNSGMSLPLSAMVLLFSI